MLKTKLVIPFGIDKTLIKGEEVQIVPMDVTPSIAAYWLKNHNKDNRPLSNATVLFYARQMEEGKWVGMNGTTIKFSPDGIILDAQHRLSAIVKSGVTIRTLVALGVPKESFTTLDTGKSRSGGDALAILGYENYTLLSSTASFLINWDKGKYGNAAKKGGEYSKLDNQQIVDFVKANESKLQDYCKLCQKYYNQGDKLVTPTWLSGILFILSKTHHKQAEKFIFQLATGTEIRFGSPLYMLRKKLMENKRNDDKSIPATNRLAYVIKTWNAIRLNKTIKKLSYKPSRNERFPKIA